MAAAAPMRAVATPRIEKKASHCPCLVSGSSAPNTISMASSGNVKSTESTRPRFDSVVESVTQALKAASLAVAPSALIRQSSATIATMETTTALTAGNSRWAVLTSTSPKAAVATPHRM